MDIKREPGKKLILEIGANVKPQAQEIYPNDKIVIMDVDKDLKPDILMDAGKMTYKNKFDAILASHVLEHFPYHDTFSVLERWRDALVKGGKLHILVPSWEWSARQVLSESPSKALWGHTFAGLTNEWDVHKCMFTMRNLRYLFDKVGLNVTEARTTKYTLMIYGERMEAEQHYVVGEKQ